jgi:glycerol-3-phosphate O-acyltransferase
MHLLKEKIKFLFASFFCKRFLGHIPHPAQDAFFEKEHEYIVAYVHRSKSILLHYALLRAISFNKLTPIAASAFDTQKKKKTFFEVVHSASGALEFFLRTPRTMTGNKACYPDYVRTLIYLQRQIEKPILLIPQVLMLGNRPHQKHLSTTDMIFGSRQEPGFIRLFIRILLCYRWAKWQVTEPLNLKTFISERHYQSDDNLARQVRWVLVKRMNNLERSYYGPPLKSHSRICFDTLRDKDLQNYMEQIEKQTGIPKIKVEKKAKNYYQEIAARFDIDIIRIADKFLSFIWKRIYENLIWQSSDINKIRSASQKGPLIIIPSHKSHMDYMVMSQILYWEGLMLPHIAAGANLSFFPLGTIFRKGGAFFIRRTFKGDPLYPQVIRAYIKRLIKERFTQEFFIEGGRSRTGKTLTPKLGLLSIMVDCLTDGKLYEAIFLPANISYEKLAEAGSYQLELTGGEKTIESARNLLGSAGVLKKKLGCVYVTFDEPISFLDFLKDRGVINSDIGEDNKKEIVKALAHRIIFGMNRCSMITPTSLIATALLGSNRRTLSHFQLLWHIKKIIRYIQINNKDARFSDEFKENYKKPIKRALQLLLNDKLLIAEKAGDSTYYRIPKASALALDYYKNNIIHYFIADAIIAAAFMALFEKNRRKKVLKSTLQNYTHSLSQIFKYEFIYSVGLPFKALFEQRLQHALDKKIFILNGDHIILASTTDANIQLHFAARLLANFIDAYWICFQKLPQAIKKSHHKNGLIAHLLSYLREAYVSGVSDFPEIVSKSTVENVLRLFEDQQVVSWNNGIPALKNQDVLEQLKKEALVLQKAHYNR